MNRQVLITFALIALTASACSKSDQNNSENNNKEHIRVNSSIDGVSVKSFVDQTTALTDIQFLRIDDRSTNLSTFDFSAAASLTGSRVAGVSAPVVFSPTQSYLTATDETAYFVGYHPAGTVAGTEVSWEPKGATFLCCYQKACTFTDYFF